MKKPPEIRSQYLPNDAEYEDLRFIYERKQSMADARGKYEKEWEAADKQYEMYREAKVDWQSNIVLPTTTAIVESQLSEIIDQNIRPRYLPRGVEDKPRAIVMNATSDYAWEVGRTDIELYKATKDALVRGTGILQDYYRKESRQVEMSEKDKKTIKEMVTYDDLFAEAVKLEDFYVDERARSFFGAYEAKDCIRRFIMHKDDFDNFFKGKIWDPLGNAKYVKTGGDTSYWEFYKPPEGIDKEKDVEVLWYWSMRPTPGRPDVSDHLMIVANDVMIKRGPNPYWHKRLPFVRVVDILKSHHFYGTGESKLLESIQEEQTTLRRMVIDRNHLDIDKSFLVSNRETELDDEDIVSRPHNLIPVEDPNNVKPLEYGDLPRSVFLSLQQLSEDAVRVTGYDDRMQSVQKSGATATEAAIMKEATLKRLRTKIWLLRNETIYQMGVLRESNIRQYYTKPKVERIIGDKMSADYRREVRDAYNSGTLKLINGQPYREKYRNIRLTDKELVVDKDKNAITVRQSKDPTFFEVFPDLITPAWGHFDVKIEPTPTLPVSKPLQQEQASQMFDRLIQLSLQGGLYDPTKLGDLLLEVNDFDPDNFKPEKSLKEKMSNNMVAKSVDMAAIENQEMMKGGQLPPTPMATEPHTEVHIAFLSSPEMDQIGPDSPILATLTRHIMGEIQAQELRAQQAPQAEQQMQYRPPSGPSAMGNMAMPASAENQQNANAMGEAMGEINGG